MKKQIYFTLIVLLTWVIVGCSDNRPDILKAKAKFEQLYPSVVIISVSISEDEVVARSFRFRYRKPNDSTEKQIEIQFMQNENTKQWEPIPEAPKELP